VSTASIRQDGFTSDSTPPRLSAADRTPTTSRGVRLEVSGRLTRSIQANDTIAGQVRKDPALYGGHVRAIAHKVTLVSGNKDPVTRCSRDRLWTLLSLLARLPSRRANEVSAFSIALPGYGERHSRYELRRPLICMIAEPVVHRVSRVENVTSRVATRVAAFPANAWIGTRSKSGLQPRGQIGAEDAGASPGENDGEPGEGRYPRHLAAAVAGVPDWRAPLRGG
jgi:hypothetical protein